MNLIPGIIAAIETDILTHWPDTIAKEGAFDARAFLFRKKEFGHIHRYGDLDIVFGKTIVTELVQKGLANRHRHIPAVGIAYPIHTGDQVPFARALLRFSYLLRVRKAHANDPAAQQRFEQELTKLPDVFSTLSLE